MSVLKASYSSASGSSVSLTVTAITLNVGECIKLCLCVCDRLYSAALIVVLNSLNSLKPQT